MNITWNALKVGAALLFAALAAFAAAQPAHALDAVEPMVPLSNLEAERCFATPDSGVTVFATVDSRAVHSATLAAAAGGTVKIAGYCAGTHGAANAVITLDTVLTLAGGYTSTNWGTYAPELNPTTLDALGTGRGIDITAPDATLLGLHVTNGNVTAGGGGGIRAAGVLTMADMQVYSNTSGAFSFKPAPPDGKGGGLFVAGEATVMSSHFLSNSADVDGGGAWFGQAARVFDARFDANLAGNRGEAYGFGGGAFFASSANISATRFNHNTVAGRNGAGAYVGGAATVAGSEFNGNRIDRGNGSGAGAYFVQDAEIENTRFMTNSATNDGGGASFKQRASVSGTRFVSNTGSYGGGARFDAAVWITRTEFSENKAEVGGGAAFFGGADIKVRESAFVNNMARIVGAGGLFDGRSSVTHSRFEGNACNPCNASGGGAIAAFGALTVTASHFISNSSGGVAGGLLFGDGETDGDERLWLENNLFARNHAQRGGLALHVGGPAQSVLLHNTLANPLTGTQAHTPAAPAIYVLSGTMALTNTIFQHFAIGVQGEAAAASHDYTLNHAVVTPTAGSATAGTHQYAGDPGFVAEQADNYRVTRGSPARNAGALAGVTADFEREQRDNRPDLGYDEFVFRTFLPGVAR